MVQASLASSTLAKTAAVCIASLRPADTHKLICSNLATGGGCVSFNGNGVVFYQRVTFDAENKRQKDQTNTREKLQQSTPFVLFFFPPCAKRENALSFTQRIANNGKEENLE